MKEDKIVCHNVRHGLSISPQREYKPCCIYPKSLANNLQDYLNSPELAQLKADFDQGIKPLSCQECWDDETAGHPSKRTIDNKYVFKDMPHNIGFYSIMVAFGNSCNLACRTCGSYSSTTWIQEEKKLNQQGMDNTIHPHNRFYQEKSFIDELKSISKDVRHVYFMGGESFLAGINEHLEYLDYLTTLGNGIHLHYTTNATIFPTEKFWNRWKKFKKVDIQLSIDGIREHFEYTRWPAKWDQVYENIKKFQELSRGNDKIKLSVGHVVSIFTVYYYPEFYKWCLQNKLTDPFISLLSNKPEYDIRALPKAVKDKVREKLSKYHFDEIINYMYQADLSEHLVTGEEYINLLDQQRGQSFKETFPEFYQILKDHNETTTTG